MKVKRISIFLIFSLTTLSVFAVMSTPTAGLGLIFGGSYRGDGNDLDLSLLEPGDIFLVKGCVAPLLEKWFMGNWDWTHVAMYVGDVNGDGEGDLMEAWGQGARIIDADNILICSKAAIYRVNCDTSIKQAAIDWILGMEGVAYDYELSRAIRSWNKYDAVKELEDDPQTAAYVCGELVWAAYMFGSGESVDIDASDWAWTSEYEYTVNSEEIAADELTWCVDVSD